MKIKLNVKFVDFWPGFNVSNNYFYQLLSIKYEVIFNDNPDILFFSNYGKEYRKYKCIRIFFSAENERPDFTCCDFAFTFDYLNSKNHFRLPLYVLYLDRANKLEYLTSKMKLEEAKMNWEKKTKFCCLVVSNSRAKERINFFYELSKIKKVDSGGRYLNNIGGAVIDKLEFIKDYKFVISFENSSHLGYTTEKILEPLMVNSIPIYWGNAEINQEFNPKCFINANNLENLNDIIDLILKIDNDDNLALTYLVEEKIINYHDKQYFDKNEILLFIENAIKLKKTVGNSIYFQMLHSFKRKRKIINYYIDKIIGYSQSKYK
jgi:hypothetical protein